MAGLKGLTVNTAPEAEPQIYAEDDAAVFQTMFGEDGVSSIGQACKATVLSNNKVRVADGVICVGGHFARIPYGEYEDCEIANGQSGKNRNDIIVARFETTGTGGIDTYTCEVKQGTPGDAATDPELTQDNLYNGGKVRELPLYRVKIEGISIVAVEQMFDVVPTNAELIKTVTELNGKMSVDAPIYYGNNKVRLYRQGNQRTLVLDGWNYKAGTLYLEEKDIPKASFPFSAHCVGGTVIGYAVIASSGLINIYNQQNGTTVGNASNVVGSVTYYV